MNDVACECACAAVRSKDAQKQLARTSLIRSMLFVYHKEKSISIVDFPSLQYCSYC